MRKVLVVDDQRDVANALRRVLRSAGFEVAVAYSPEDALALFDAFDPSLVVSDFEMGAMNGEQMLRMMMRRKPSLKGLILSGHPRIRVSEQFGFMNKPWDTSALLGALAA
ncbi:MAG: response regulator [Myxococcaceae bacterium]